MLRVDELRKRAGTACRHVVPGKGCAIHATRPPICRAYRCLWLQGGLEPEDRPDRLGAVLDLLTTGAETRLEVQQASPDAFDVSPRLQEIVARYRAAMPVRLTDVADPDDPDRPYRILHPDGSETRVEGDRIRRLQEGALVEELRLPLLERTIRRVQAAWRRWRQRGFGAGD